MPAKKSGRPAVIDGDGWYLIGEDIQAGTYKAAGPTDDNFGLGCYRARLKNASGEPDEITANSNITGQARVTTRQGEHFETWAARSGRRPADTSDATHFLRTGGAGLLRALGRPLPAPHPPGVRRSAPRQSLNERNHRDVRP